MFKKRTFISLLIMFALLPIGLGVFITMGNTPQIKNVATVSPFEERYQSEIIREYEATLKHRNGKPPTMENGDKLYIPEPPVITNNDNSIGTLFGFTVSEFLLLIGGINGIVLSWFQLIIGMKRFQNTRKIE